MLPMPCGLLRADQGIRGGAPFSGGLLAPQSKAACTRTRQLHQAGRHAATSVRIEQGAHRFRNGHRLNRLGAVARSPAGPTTAATWLTQAGGDYPASGAGAAGPNSLMNRLV
jgi:hypothetical protein